LSYTRYHEVETLFIKWPLLKAIRESSLIELEAVGAKESIGTENEFIYTLTVGNKAMNDMPYATANNVSNPTEKVASSYAKIIQNHISNTDKEIKEEILKLWLIDEKLRIAFNALTRLQQQILKLYYWEKNTWTETVEKLKKDNYYCSKSQAQSLRKQGIEKMNKISKISLKMYNEIMKIIDEHQNV